MLVFPAIFLASFVTALSGAMMPGPLLSFSISESARRGFIVGPLIIAGHALLELGLLVALLLGLAPLLKSDTAFIVIAFAGSGILLWMAAGMFRQLGRLSLSLQAQKEPRGHLVLNGALMSLANPYWIIWWATFGLTLILRIKEFGAWGIAFFFAGHISADLAWYSAVAAAVGKGRRFLSDRVYRVVIGVCAAFLVGIALYFIYSAFCRATA